MSKKTLKERFERHFGTIPCEWHFKGNELVCISSAVLPREEETIVGRIAYVGNEAEGFHHHVEVTRYRNMHKVVNGSSWIVVEELSDNVGSPCEARRKTEALIDLMIDEAIKESQFYGKV